MKKNELVLEFMKVIAPIFAKEGLNTMQKIIDAGANPDDCTIQGKSIIENYTRNTLIWAVEFADEYNAYKLLEKIPKP